MSMTVSLPGTLKRAAEVCARSRDWKHLEWCLVTLLDHLREVRAHKDEPDILDKFFAIWSDEACSTESGASGNGSASATASAAESSPAGP